MGYKLVDKGSLVELWAEGQFTLADAETILTDLRQAEEFSSMRSFMIIDQGTSFDPSKEELARMTELFVSLLATRDLRIALVVAKLMHYGLGRMVEALAGTQGDRFRAFMQEEEARAWLMEMSG